MSAFDRSVLRAVLGKESFDDVEHVGRLLDSMVRRGSISEEGLSTVLEHLAEELVAQAVAIDFASSLTDEEMRGDTAGSEDSPT